MAVSGLAHCWVLRRHLVVGVVLGPRPVLVVLTLPGVGVVGGVGFWCVVVC